MGKVLPTTELNHISALLFLLLLFISLSAQAAKVKELELLRAEMDKLKQENQGIYVCAHKFAYTHHRHECRNEV